MSMYKKVMMLVVATAALCLSEGALARCVSCAEKLAIKQSIKDVAAAALAAKPSGKKDVQLDVLEDEYSEVECDQDKSPCCASCQAGEECESTRCSCLSDRDVNDPDMRDLACLLEQLIKKSSKCCKEVNHRLKKQGHRADRCCSNIEDSLDDLEVLVTSVADQTAACCSVNSAALLDLTFRASLNDIAMVQLTALVQQVFNCTCL